MDFHINDIDQQTWDKRSREECDKIKTNKSFILSGRSEEDLHSDINFLVSLWDGVLQKAEKSSSPSLLHTDLNVVYRTLRDSLSKEVRKLVVNEREEYRQIRQAKKIDLSSIIALTKNAVEAAELADRSLSEIEANIGEYHLFEIDGNPVGCFSLSILSENKIGELGSVCVSPAHENQGIGSKLVDYAEKLAKENGLNKLFVLSTLTFKWFQLKASFVEGELSELPQSRQASANASGRNSKVLFKSLE